MSIAAAQAQAFFLEAVKAAAVWTIEDEGGIPAPKNGCGERAMPFWSSENRVKSIIKNVSAYQGFSPLRLTLDEFFEKWLPDLEKDGLKVGVNWSGGRATGYDYSVADSRARFQYVIDDGLPPMVTEL